MYVILMAAQQPALMRAHRAEGPEDLLLSRRRKTHPSSNCLDESLSVVGAERARDVFTVDLHVAEELSLLAALPFDDDLIAIEANITDL